MLPAASSRLADFQPGDILDGRYRILRKLAEGGMGTVFLAEHLLIKRRVAIKRLHAELASDGTMVQRFLREATAAGTLGHPHIVESTDCGFAQDGTPYIVFEYLEGCLLVEEIHRLGKLPVRRAVTIARQIASALEVAHAAQIVHLDLKSDNVFLTDDGESVDHAKLIDFGISRFMAADADNTQPGLLMGTPEFMAPEQIVVPDQVDCRADIYALGVMLYEMLTGRCPHAGADQRVLLHRIVWEAPAPLGIMVPPDLEALLFGRMLVKSRDYRIQTMREVKDALDDIVASLTAVPAPLPEFASGSTAAVAAQPTVTIYPGARLAASDRIPISSAIAAKRLTTPDALDDFDADEAPAREWVVESWFDDDDPRNEVTHGRVPRPDPAPGEWVVEVWD